MIRPGLAMAGIIIALTGGLALAQQPDLQQIAAGVKQNQQSLRQYALVRRAALGGRGPRGAGQHRRRDRQAARRPRLR